MKENIKKALLQDILSEISVEALAQSIGIQIDLARISFVMVYVTVCDFDEFNKDLSGYYVHLLGHLNRIKVPVNFDILSAEVFALLDRAFSNRGGIKAAFTESKCCFYTSSIT